MTRYWVLVSDALMAGELERFLPDGLRLVSPVPPAEHDAALQTGLARPPGLASRLGAHWRQFEDDGAPAELDGHRVELILEARDGRPVIAARRRLT